MNKDYYKILGIEKSASPDDVKAAFRRLAMKHHPDKGGDQQKFKEINEAYQVLSNSEKRAQYDQFGTNYEGMSGGPFRWEDVSQNIDFNDLGDIFGDFFSAQGGPSSGWGGGFRTSRGQRTGRQRGRDIQVDMTIDFLESVFGAKKEIELYKDIACKECNGEGVAKGSKRINCKTCNGTGQVVQQKRILFGAFQVAAPCSDCGGIGSKPEKNCPKCGGTGAIKGEEKLEIKIPAGISSGGVVRLLGKGEVGKYGTGSGDLYIQIRVKPDKRFQRDNYNILTRKEISFSQAALGCKIDIETVDGEVELKIPAGIQSGEVIRLKDRGVPYLQSSGRGDHLVVIVVKTPKKLSRKAKKLLEGLGDEGV